MPAAFATSSPTTNFGSVCFPRRAAPGELERLCPGELPDSYERRKAAKPDLEALMQLPPFANYHDGALLALGSGFTPNRELGALLPLDAFGRVSGEPQAIDLGGV